MHTSHLENLSSTELRERHHYNLRILMALESTRIEGTLPASGEHYLKHFWGECGAIEKILASR